MKEKILAALITKFQGIDEAILTRIAEKKANGVTDESQIPTIIEGVSFQDVLTYYGDFRAGDAQLSSIRNYEKKHNLKDGKPIENPNSNPNPEPPKPDDITAIIASAVNAAVKPLSDKLAGFEQKEVQAKRSTDILAKAKEYGIPESFATKFNIAEDADLDEYFKGMKQDFANIGFEGVKPPESGSGEGGGNEIADLINAGTKQIVEQNKK